MRFSKLLFFAGLIGIPLLASPWDAESAQRRDPCRGGDRIRIQDLDVAPDPLVEGERINGWRVRIRLDGNRECETEIEIREGNEVVAQGDYRLRPGINEIQLRPLERYRFQRGQHCFEVLADLEGTRRKVDADRQFCARQRPAWSMRERDERGRDERGRPPR
jgi:hypothetical protein